MAQKKTYFHTDGKSLSLKIHYMVIYEYDMVKTNIHNKSI